MKKIKESLKREIQEIYSHIVLKNTSCNITVIDFSNSDWENQFIKLVNLVVGWNWITRECKLSRMFIYRYQNVLDQNFCWYNVILFQEIHKCDIKKYFNKVSGFKDNISYLLTYQKLDEKFIEFLLLNKPLLLPDISKYQKVSKKFILLVYVLFTVYHF